MSNSVTQYSAQHHTLLHYNENQSHVIKNMVCGPPSTHPNFSMMMIRALVDGQLISLQDDCSKDKIGWGHMTCGPAGSPWADCRCEMWNSYVYRPWKQCTSKISYIAVYSARPRSWLLIIKILGPCTKIAEVNECSMLNIPDS